jgi:hypothetical protein
MAFKCGVIDMVVYVVLPTLFEDVNKRMDTWGSEGKINPFEDVYKVGVRFFSQQMCD